MFSLRTFLVAAVSATALTACQQASEPAASNAASPANEVEAANERASAERAATPRLIDANGQEIGRVFMSEDAAGVTLRVIAEGLPEGKHGVHLHEKGICEPPFATAGAHWNPTSKKHGRDNANGAHLGDLDNLDAKAGSGSEMTVTIPGVTIRGDEGDKIKLADADGTSLVIHADEDDYKTDPSGNSGDRIACAVLTN